jgi:hypothetical protein
MNAEQSEAEAEINSVIRVKVVECIHDFYRDLPEDAEQIELVTESWAVWTIDGTPTPWRDAAVNIK